MDVIPGWAELVELVGATPAFADARILNLAITLSGEATITIHTFAMPDGVKYDYDKPLIIDVEMRGLAAVDLDEFAPSAALDELKIERQGIDWVVALESDS